MTTEEPTITLKAEGRDAMWIVLRGDAASMVQQVKDLFRFPDEEIAGLDPIEVFINADSTLKAMTSMSSNLGARPIASKDWADKGHPEGLGGPEKPAEVAPAPMPTQAPEEPQSPFQDVLDRIRACATLAELKGVWEAEQATGSGAFKDQSVIDAYKATG